MTGVRVWVAGLALAAWLGFSGGVSAATLTSDNRETWSETDVPFQNHDGTIGYNLVLRTDSPNPAYSGFTSSLANPTDPAVVASQTSTVSPNHMQGTGGAGSVPNTSILRLAFSVFDVSFSLAQPAFAQLGGELDLSGLGSGNLTDLISTVALSSGPNTLFSAAGPTAVGSQPFAFSGVLPAGNYNLRIRTEVQGITATLGYSFAFDVPEPSQLMLVAGALGFVFVGSRRQSAAGADE
jgi:hypothetical protein